MNPLKILTSPLINRAALARAMWPNVKDAKVKLAQKLSPSNKKQRITEKDEELIIQVIEDLCKCEEPEIKPEILCDGCGWEGMLEELRVQSLPRSGDFDTCPNCKEADYLKDINQN